MSKIQMYLMAKNSKKEKESEYLDDSVENNESDDIEFLDDEFEEEKV